MGLAVALTAALLWSFYSLGILFLNVLAGAFSDYAGYADLFGFDWAGYLYKFLAQLFAISLGAGVVSWFAAEIYNDLNQVLDKKLK